MGFKSKLRAEGQKYFPRAHPPDPPDVVKPRGSGVENQFSAAARTTRGGKIRVALCIFFTHDF